MKRDRLVKLLELAHDEFEHDKRNGGREGTVAAVAVATVYLQELLPERPELVKSLKNLLSAMKDLEAGVRYPLLQPKGRGGRPTRGHAARRLAAMVAATVELMVKSGLTGKQAHEQIAQRLHRTRIQRQRKG